MILGIQLHVSLVLLLASSTVLDALSLHDALPISLPLIASAWPSTSRESLTLTPSDSAKNSASRCLANSSERSEEHTSELQSRGHLVCRLLPEKRKMRS